MDVTRQVAPLARWALVGAVALMGAALCLTAWSTYAGVQRATQFVVQGQANGLQQAVRGFLFSITDPLTTSDLEALIAEESDAGLRYIAVASRDGTLLQAGAPEGSVPDASGRVALEGPRWLRDRVRVVFRARAGRPERGEHFPSRRGPERREGKAQQVLVMEFEPVQAKALRAASYRTLVIGSVAAVTLFILAAFLLRSVLRREALERRHAQDQRLASLGEMSAVLAHEIRNPLASLKGNAQLLAEMLVGSERPKAKADRVVTEARRLETLTNNLLEYVRTGSLHREAVDPGQLLRTCVADLPGSEAIQLVVAPELGSWRLDSHRMTQVLNNLLTNALQAGAPVKATVTHQHQQLIFEVQDSGTGVPPSERERIFEPFYTRRTNGTGLGLSLAKRIVELHGGTISVDTAPGGVGALFRVALPRS